MNFNHILLTTDLQEPIQSVFEFTAYQAKMTGSKVTLLHVYEPFRVPPELNRVIWNPERLHEMEKEYLESTREQLEALAKKYMHKESVEIVTLASDHSIGKTITDYAEKNEVDCIVMAGHGRGVVGQLLLGSTVQKVLAAAVCPVMVLPAGKQEG